MPANDNGALSLDDAPRVHAHDRDYVARDTIGVVRFGQTIPDWRGFSTDEPLYIAGTPFICVFLDLGHRIVHWVRTLLFLRVSVWVGYRAPPVRGLTYHGMRHVSERCPRVRTVHDCCTRLVRR